MSDSMMSAHERMLKAKLEAWKAQKKGGKSSVGLATGGVASKRPHAYVPPPLFSSSSSSSVSTPGTIQRIKTMRQEQIGPFSSSSYAASCASSSSSGSGGTNSSSSGSSGSSSSGGKGKQASKVGGESQQENDDPNLPSAFALSLRFDGPPSPERKVEEGEQSKMVRKEENECASCARLREEAADGIQERLRAQCGLEQRALEADDLRRQLDEALTSAARHADRVAAQEEAMHELSARRAEDKASNEATVAELRAVSAANEALLQQVDGFTVQVNELSDLRRGEKVAMRARDAELEARVARAEQGEQTACAALAREATRTAMALEDAHATAFLYAVQEQRIDELQRRDRREQEDALAAQLERVRQQHVAEVRRLQRDKNDYEVSANECIQTMTQQMSMIQTMTMRKIEALERELNEWRDGTRTRS